MASLQAGRRMRIDTITNDGVVVKPVVARTAALPKAWSALVLSIAFGLMNVPTINAQSQAVAPVDKVPQSAPAASTAASARTATALSSQTPVNPTQSAPTSSSAFEVVSIRPNPVPAGQTAFKEFKLRPAPHATGNRFIDRQTTLQYLVMEAYGVWDYRISGLPDWAQAPNGEHYDLEATMENEATPTTEQLQVLLRTMLADRFSLRLHREKKNLPVYA